MIGAQEEFVTAPKTNIEALCVSKGMRMTEQRRVIARVLAAADDHPDVEELYRRTLSALVPVLIGDPDDGLFAPRTAFSRRRVQSVFHEAVGAARDAPKPDIVGPLGRLLYLVHLAVLLWWLLDKSARQRATTGLVTLIQRTLSLAALALPLPPVQMIIRSGDTLFREALFDDAG